MKNQLTIIILLLISHNSISQKLSQVTFIDGTVKGGNYEAKMPLLANSHSRVKIHNEETGEKYSLHDITSAQYYGDKDTLNYKVIDTKVNIKDKPEKRFGLVAFRGRKVEVFYVDSFVNAGNVQGDATDIYALKHNDPVACHIGPIYGLKYQGLRKRLENFFNDCPNLISKIDKGIKKEEYKEIVNFYESQCTD